MPAAGGPGGGGAGGTTEVLHIGAYVPHRRQGPPGLHGAPAAPTRGECIVE